MKCFPTVENGNARAEVAGMLLRGLERADGLRLRRAGLTGRAS